MNAESSTTMNKITGILMLLIYICVATSLLAPNFTTPYNMQNIVRWSALFGIIGIGVAFPIITGGIDLSIGSLIGLVGSLMPMLMIGWGWSVPATLGAVLLLALLLGLLHGLLITKVGLQPFVVTLCGLLFYRGFARWLTNDQTQGFGSAYDDSLRLLATGKPCSVAFLLLLAGVALCVWYGFRRRADDDVAEQNGNLRWFGVATGIALVVIGSSRYWQGFEIVWGDEPLIALGSWSLPSWSVTVPPDAVDQPGTWMRGMGWLALPAVIWLLIVSLRGETAQTPDSERSAESDLSADSERSPATEPPADTEPLEPSANTEASLVVSPESVGRSTSNRSRVIGSLVALIVASLAVAAAYYVEADAMMIPEALQRPMKMATVFLSLGALMFAIASFARVCLKAGGTAAQLPLAVAAVTSILALAGLTPLGRTLVPAPMIALGIIGALAGIFLNQTIYGRYLLALGKNEEAARYSGIATDRMVILAYVICSGLAGVGGILFALDGNSIQPSGHGNFYELYAIAAAVLGGCSLRGGEGSILGVIIGAAVMRVLYNSINLLRIPSQLEFAIIGMVILIGVTADEMVRRYANRKVNRG